MSEEISCCSNHTCTSQFDKAADEYITCSLCLKPAYCSDECRLLDWPAHACPNVHQTNDLKVGFAVPYYYEDMLTAEDLQDAPIDSPIFQTHQVTHYNANRTVSQYTVPSLVEKNAQSKDDEAPIARGKNPSKLLTLKDTNYTLKISAGGRTINVVGQIPNDMIYKENTTNKTAQALSGGGSTFGEKVKNVFRGGLRRALHSAETSYIFWPPNHRVRENLIELDLAGDIEVALYVKDTSGTEKRISYVSAGYKLPVPGKNDAAAAGRKLQQMFRSQVEMKFKGSDLSTKNLYVRRYSDFEGNGVILTFEITPGSYKAKLVDLEYIVDAERVKQAELPSSTTTSSEKDALKKSLEEIPDVPERDESLISSRYACNVRNFEEIMGLSMALETFIANDSNQTAARALESHSGIIKEYVHKMQENQGVAPNSIPPEVDVAVMTAVNAMYEPIGMSQSQWDKKALGTFTNFERDVERIIARLGELRAASSEEDPSRAKGKIKRGLRTVFQKKPLLADLDRILKAIDKRTGSFGEDGASDEVKTKWNTLREKVVQAKRSGGGV